MSERRDKSNKKFMLLSAIGIFMVVDHHTFTAFNVLGDFLPYNSFFMPMFVFISGYFNKVDGNTNLWAYLLKKIKTLLIPYVGLSLTVFGLQQLINYIKLGNGMDALPDGYLSYVLRRVVTTGSFGPIAEPMWFVIALFSVLMIYAVIKKFLCKMKLWNSYVMFVLFCGLHLFVIYLAKNVAFESLENWLVPLKCLFFLPFLELGILYKEHFEKKHTAMSETGKVALLFALLAVNVIRTCYMPMPYDIAFDSIDVLGGFTSPYIVTPMVSSLIGILFWLTAAELIGKPVYESRFVNFMSCNTFWIMGLHITFYNIFNCILMEINRSIVKVPHFDTEAFRETEWYFWEAGGNTKMFYVIVGVLGPLGLKWIYDRLCAAVDGKIRHIAAGSEQKTGHISTVSEQKTGHISTESEQKTGHISAGSEQKTGRLIALSRVVFALLLASTVGLIVVLTRPDTTGNASDNPGQNTEENGPGNTENDTPGTEVTGTADKEISPVYAYLDIAYEAGGIDSDYLSEACEVKGDGTYTFSVNRQDNSEVSQAIDGLSYMGIRLLDDDQADVDITAAEITDIKVVCDGVELKVEISGSTQYTDGVILAFFDCYDAETYGDGADVSAAAAYDFSGKSTIEVTFTVEGAKAEQY